MEKKKKISNSLLCKNAQDISIHLFLAVNKVFIPSTLFSLYRQGHEGVLKKICFLVKKSIFSD